MYVFFYFLINKVPLVFFVPEMTSKQVNDENEALSNTMYKLLKKYLAIRSILKTLNVSCLPDLNLGGLVLYNFL